MIGALVDAGRRHRLPLGELRAYMGSMRARLRARAHRDLGRARHLHGGLARARSGASWPRCSASPRTITRASGASGSPSSTRTSSATCARTGAWTASTCRARTAAASGSPTPTSPPPRRPELRALVANEVRRARELFASADAAVEAAPASVRPGIRLACAIYLGVLDRVEATGYDVLGRRPRLPAWQLPLVALAALKR